jgi:Pyrimidine dimer DNA glycosylase
MRIWSLHPHYLDRQGLTACWRETLLAQAVLAGRTRGYTRHPQLQRFREQPDPIGALAWYLHGVADEADRRGYQFARERIDRKAEAAPPIAVTAGQLQLEWVWLLSKLKARSPSDFHQWSGVGEPETHPSFHEVEGPVASWERLKPSEIDWGGA